MALYDDELRRAQQFRAQLAAQQQAQNAARDYENRVVAAQQSQKQAPSGLGAVLSGIGESIGNVGKALGDFAVRGSIAAYGATGLKSLLEGKDYLAANNEASRDQDDFLRRYYGTDSTKDAANKAAGTALDAAATISELIPVVGGAAKAATTGAKVGTTALNLAQGAASGAAQNYIRNGENATLEDSLKSALAGAAGAGVGQAVGGKLAKSAATNPAKGIIGKAAQSGIGRSALTGAASGAVGSGVSTALYGGDLGQTLAGAAQGAKSGALSGAATGAITGVVGAGANKAGEKFKEKFWHKAPTNVVEAPIQTEETNPAKLSRQKATGWDGESLSGAGKKRNYAQKLGADLQDAAQATRDASVYGKLKGNTADEMIKKDAINNLRKNYGYAPDDYAQASKVSEAVNKWYDNEIQRSGAQKVNRDLQDQLSLPSNNTLPKKYEKAYRETINNALTMANAGDSNVVDMYSANGLEKAAKYLGQQEQNMLRTNMNGVDGRVDGDRLELASYYKNARQALRNEVNSMIELDDITKENLSKMLDDAGATKEAKKTILSAQNFAEVKSATSPLEDARTMNKQMRSSTLKRGASADSSVSASTQLMRATGASNLVDVAGNPIRKFAAAGENALGKLVSKAGDIASGSEAAGKVLRGAAKPIKVANSGLNGGFGDLATSEISRREASMAGQNVKDQLDNAAAEQEAINAKKDYDNTIAAIQQANLANQQQSSAAVYAQNQLSNIKTAMDAALAAGDITAYGQLADLYQQAYKVYGSELEAAQKSSNPYSNLSSTQIENINKLENAGNAIDELEQLFNKAGGGQGLIGGNTANFMASLGLNSDVSTYNSLSRGLVNQISAAIGKTDSLNTEGEVNRALELIPKFTDDAQTAKNKLEQLRQMLANTKSSAYKTYGLSQ